MLEDGTLPLHTSSEDEAPGEDTHAPDSVAQYGHQPEEDALPDRPARRPPLDETQTLSDTPPDLPDAGVLSERVGSHQEQQIPPQPGSLGSFPPQEHPPPICDRARLHVGYASGQRGLPEQPPRQTSTSATPGARDSQSVTTEGTATGRPPTQGSTGLPSGPNATMQRGPWSRAEFHRRQLRVRRAALPKEARRQAKAVKQLAKGSNGRSENTDRMLLRGNASSPRCSMQMEKGVQKNVESTNFPKGPSTQI